MSAPVSSNVSPDPAPDLQNRESLLLEEAARLLENRMVAIRSGSPPLHVVLELERAARAIRALLIDVGRLHDPGLERMGSAAAALRGPPILQRVTRLDAQSQELNESDAGAAIP